MEGLPSDSLAARPFVWHSRGKKKALLTASVGLGGSEENATLGLYLLLPRRVAYTGLFTGRPETDAELCKRGSPLTGDLAKTRVFTQVAAQVCWSQTPAAAALQSVGANRSSAFETNI